MAHPKVEKLDELREKCGFSKKRIAKRLDVTPVTYSYWLAQPSPEQLEEIEKLIGKLKKINDRM